MSWAEVSGGAYLCRGVPTRRHQRAVEAGLATRERSAVRISWCDEARDLAARCVWLVGLATARCAADDRRVARRAARCRDRCAEGDGRRARRRLRSAEG